MQFQLITPSTPFAENPTVLGSGTSFRGHYRKLSKDFLATDVIGLQVDSTMVSPYRNGKPELSPYPEHELNQEEKQFHCQKFTQTPEQEQLDLSSDMIPENIFNSGFSGLVYPNIPQASSVHSFLGANNPTVLTITSPVEVPSFADSTIVSYSDQALQEEFSCGLSSKEKKLTFPPRLVESMATSTTSLEAVVNSKRKKLLRPQNKLLNVDPSYDMGELALMTLKYSKFPLVRGYRCGGNNNRPPSKRLLPGTKYLSVCLRLENVSWKELCVPQWNTEEIKDGRRIIRIEKKRQSNEIVASFSIVGSATENPDTKPSSEPDLEVLEVSCLQWPVDETKYNREQDDSGSPSQKQIRATALSRQNVGSYRLPDSVAEHQYYITSVEVIKIVEMLVGNHSFQNGQQKRNERARIRSNLVPFWSKYCLFPSTDSLNNQVEPTCKEVEFSKLFHRIMSYEVRRPRVFNKNVRIMKWSELGAALQRALRSYYVAVPQNDQNSE